MVNGLEFNFKESNQVIGDQKDIENVPSETIKIKTEVSHVPEQVFKDFKTARCCSDADQLTVVTRRIFDHIDQNKNDTIEGEEIIQFYEKMN